MNNKLSLADVQSNLNDIPYINTGGCGVAALVLYRHLVSNNKKPKIVLLYRKYEECDLEFNARKIETGDYRNLIVPYHICIIWKGQRIDSEGYDAHATCNTDLEQTITEDILIELLNTGEWNDNFDRSYIGAIEFQNNVKLPHLGRPY